MTRSFKMSNSRDNNDNIDWSLWPASPLNLNADAEFDSDLFYNDLAKIVSAQQEDEPEQLYSQRIQSELPSEILSTTDQQASYEENSMSLESDSIATATAIKNHHNQVFTRKVKYPDGRKISVCFANFDPIPDEVKFVSIPFGEQKRHRPGSAAITLKAVYKDGRGDYPNIDGEHNVIFYDTHKKRVSSLKKKQKLQPLESFLGINLQRTNTQSENDFVAPEPILETIPSSTLTINNQILWENIAAYEATTRSVLIMPVPPEYQADSIITEIQKRISAQNEIKPINLKLGVTYLPQINSIQIDKKGKYPTVRDILTKIGINFNYGKTNVTEPVKTTQIKQPTRPVVTETVDIMPDASISTDDITVDSSQNAKVIYTTKHGQVAFTCNESTNYAIASLKHIDIAKHYLIKRLICEKIKNTTDSSSGKVKYNTDSLSIEISLNPNDPSITQILKGEFVNIIWSDINAFVASKKIRVYATDKNPNLNHIRRAIKSRFKSGEGQQYVSLYGIDVELCKNDEYISIYTYKLNDDNFSIKQVLDQLKMNFNYLDADPILQPVPSAAIQTASTDTVETILTFDTQIVWGTITASEISPKHVLILSMPNVYQLDVINDKIQNIISERSKINPAFSKLEIIYDPQINSLHIGKSTNHPTVKSLLNELGIKFNYGIVKPVETTRTAPSSYLTHNMFTMQTSKSTKPVEDNYVSKGMRKPDNYK